MTTLNPETFLDTPRYAAGWATKFGLYETLRREFLLDAGDRWDARVLSGGSGWGKTILGRLHLLYAITRALEEDAAGTLGIGDGRLLFLVMVPPSATREAHEVLAWLEDAARLIPALSEGPNRAVRYSTPELRFGPVSVRSCKTNERPVGYVAGGLVEYVDLDTFRYLRLRMREALRGLVTGSLTWCTDEPRILVDPKATQTFLPSWGSKPIPREDFGALWVRLLPELFRFELVTSTYGPSATDQGRWYRVPRAYEAQVRQMDPDAMLRHFFGIRAV